MIEDPWTSPDPQPGDFDEDLRTMGPNDVQVVEGGSGAVVKYLISIEGEDAAKLERLARQRGQAMDEVVADLVRAAG